MQREATNDEELAREIKKAARRAGENTHICSVYG